MHTICRTFDRIYRTITIDEWPIHISGSGLFVWNESQTLTVTLRVYDSDDGVTWNVVDFATPTNHGLTSIDVIPHSYASILFQSARRYVRFELDENNPDGMFFHLVQWQPRNPELSDNY